MKNIFQNRIIVIVWLILIADLCTNSSRHSLSDIKNHKNNIANATTASKNSVLNEHEVIGGWLKEQTNQAVVIDRLGLPENKGKDEYWGATGDYVQEWEYNTAGIILMMESENQGGVKKVLLITIMQPCILTTSQGVGIGSNEKSIREKYHKLIDVRNSSSKLIVVGSIYGGTIFTLKNGTVYKISIGAAAE